MKTEPGLLARGARTLFALAILLTSGIAGAQSSSAKGGDHQPVAAAGHESSMDSGMGMGGQNMNPMSGSETGGAMGKMMGMGCMGGAHSEAMQIIQKDPKLKARMMQLHGEMMKLMGDAMIERSKELQGSK